MARAPFAPEENQQPPLPPTSLSPQEVRKHAAETRETARDEIARTHHIYTHTRQLTAQSNEIAQHHRAWRERHTEHHPHPTTPSGSAALPPPVSICSSRRALRLLQSRREERAFLQHQATASAAPPFQLIVADLMVAGMSAEDIVAALRTLPACRETPVILFSACDDWEGQRRRALCEARAFVQKPMQLELYLATVRTLVSRWKRQEDKP